MSLYLSCITIFFYATAALPQPSAPNKEKLLAVISSDYKKVGTYNLSLILDKDNIISAIKTVNNRRKKVKKYPASKLQSKIPLVKTLGVTLISLECKKFNPKRGCEIEISYPYNLTYGKFKTFKAKLKRVKEHWGLYSNGRHFTKFDLKAKKLLGLLVGIKEIQAI